MFNKLKRWFGGYYGRLTTIGEQEPLSKLSLAVLLGLDIFVLTMVFTGLDEHTRQLTSPSEYVPYKCQQVLINNNWSEENRLTELQRLVLRDHHNYSYRYNSIFDATKLSVMHPVCRSFYDQVKAIKDNKNIHQLFIKREALGKKQKKQRSNFKKSKDVYDTSMLTEIAGKPNKPMSSVSTSVQHQSAQYELVNSQLMEIDMQLNRSAHILELWRMISPNSSQRKQLIEDYRNFQFWYPFKELLWQLVFMLPLFIIFYLWSAYSVKKHNQVQTLISSHLLVIAALPILFKVIEVVLDLIPHHFFKALFKILESLHLMALWHYIVIFGSIGAALLIVYLIQKKIFNKERVYQKRLMKGMCYICAKKLPHDADGCPYCGTQQKHECGTCGKETYVAGPFCTHCGTIKQ